MKKNIRLKEISASHKELAVDVLFWTVGCFIFSASVAVFTAPNKMAPGGLTGVATILYYTIGTPIGLTTLLLNIPLFILGFRFIGGKFIISSIICTVISSLGVDLLSFLPKYDGNHGNMLLAALYGGVLSGIGLGLIFLRGSTTGGSDIASRLLKLRWPYVSMGRMIMLVDAVVIITSTIVFRSVDSGLYAMIQLFVSSKVIDAMLYGADTGKMVLVVSEKNKEIATAIMAELDRGVTMLKGSGFYSGNDREVLLCAVRRQQTPSLRAIVRKVDPSAFIILCEADDVIGEGFKPITKDF